MFQIILASAVAAVVEVAVARELGIVKNVTVAVAVEVAVTVTVTVMVAVVVTVL